MAVGGKDARLSQYKLREYVLKNFSSQNYIIFILLYECICVFCMLQILLNLNICYINCQQPYTDCSLFRLLLKTNYDGFLEKMSAIIIIFFSYLSNLFYYLFLYLFIIIFIHLFIYPFLVPHGEDMSLIHSKSALLFSFLFFVNELNKLRNVTEVFVLCLCCAVVHLLLILIASHSVSKYCLVRRLSKSVDIKFVMQVK